MPPVAKAGGDAFRKDVDFVAKDDDEQVAAGIVMVPDKADLQQDFAREETIRSFADQFEAFVDAGEAGGGVMHAVWPDDWMALERNEVLDEAEEIGGQSVEAGAWVQAWKIDNDELWGLIQDEIIAGYSIGAIQVAWDGPYEQAELDDVAVPDELGDALVWELTDGIIREVSAVDIPAVPDAQILETKADAEKRLGDYLGDPNGFLEEAQERGHTEAEAERLWDLLNAAVEAEGSDEPGKESRLSRAAKAFLGVLSGSDDDTAADSSEALDVTRDRDRDRQTPKAGQTLSQSNTESAMAAIDANLDMLEDAGVDHGMTRFTDREDVDFDLSEHDARSWPNDGGSGGDDNGEGDENGDGGMADADVSASKDASGGDTPDHESGTEAAAMSDDNGDTGEDKSLAEKNAEQISELSESIKDLTEAVAGPQPKTAEIEIDGDTYEVPEEAAKAALGVDEDAGVGVADAIESLKSQVEAQEQRINTISRQSGTSTQLDASRDGGSDDDGSGLDDLGKALS